ncbi:MAG: protein kinase [Nitrospirae bacterium]|nr:protein kinase [Nitrospirota bacterium]
MPWEGSCHTPLPLDVKSAAGTGLPEKPDVDKLVGEIQDLMTSQMAAPEKAPVSPSPLSPASPSPSPSQTSAPQSSATRTAARDPWIGKELGGFRVIEVVGRGGMGVVYKAEDMNLGRIVALKMVTAELSENPQMIERFKHEARAQARLTHSGIAMVYAFKQEAGESFLVMEFLQGESLRSLMNRSGILPVQETVRIALQVLSAIGYAHKMGVIHRDLKPANVVILPDGTAKVMDFGIAKVRDAQSHLTVTGSLVGTLRYMSPEQIKGLEIDHRVDLYALGISFYEMLAGRPPFEAKTDFDLMQAHLQQVPPPPSHFNPAVPAPLDKAVLKALAKDAKGRYQNAEEFAHVLSAAFRQAAPAEAAATVVSAPPTREIRPEERFVAPSEARRGPGRGLLFAGAGVAAVALIGAVVWFVGPFGAKPSGVETPAPVTRAPAPREVSPPPPPVVAPSPPKEEPKPVVAAPPPAIRPEPVPIKEPPPKTAVREAKPSTRLPTPKIGGMEGRVTVHDEPAAAPKVIPKPPSGPTPAEVRNQLLESLKRQGFGNVSVDVDASFTATIGGTVAKEDDIRKAASVVGANKSVRQVKNQVTSQEKTWGNTLKEKGRFVDE